MCICLTASQAVLEQIAKQFGILAALFFLLGITFSVGCTSGAKLLYSVFLILSFISPYSDIQELLKLFLHQ